MAEFDVSSRWVAWDGKVITSNEVRKLSGLRTLGSSPGLSGLLPGENQVTRRGRVRCLIPGSVQYIALRSILNVLQVLVHHVQLL